VVLREIDFLLKHLLIDSTALPWLRITTHEKSHFKQKLKKQCQRIGTNFVSLKGEIAEAVF